MTELRLDVYDISNASLIRTLTQAHNRQFTDDLESPGGFGSFDVDRASTDDWNTLEPRRVVRSLVKDPGEDWALRWAGVIRDMPVSLDPGVQGWVRTVELDALRAWLGYRRGGGLLYPEGGLGDPAANPRPFGPMTPGYDDSAWDDATTFGPYTDPQLQLNVGPAGETMTGNPSDYPDEEAVWIAPRALDDGSLNPFGDWPGHPEGLWRARKEITIADDNTNVDIFAAFDNTGRLWFAGGEIMTVSDPRNLEQGVTRWSGQVNAGTYVVYAEVVNSPPGRPAGPNPTGLLASVYAGGELIAKTDGTWKTLDFGEEPEGVTRGFIFSRAVTEAKDRGEIPWLTVDGWDDDTDTDNVAWAEKINHAFRMQELGRLDDDIVDLTGGETQVTPTGLLRLFEKRGQDRTGTVTVALPFGAVLSGEGPYATRYLYETDGGFGEASLSGAESSFGVMGQVLQFGTGIMPDDLAAAVLATLNRASQPSNRFDVDLPDDIVPYRDVQLGDVVNMPGPGGSLQARLAMFSLADAGSQPEWKVQAVPDV